jgi:hypothetical protein
VLQGVWDKQGHLFGLTLLLSSKESIITMLWAMQEPENAGITKGTHDMTTIISELAAEIKDKEDALNGINVENDNT